jgi:DNA-binding response OmpR family regulator
MKIAMNDLKKRVLLADDDEEVLAVMEAALLRKGYEVLIARDGAEALMRAERDAPDLIVLDVVMPRRSGFVVLQRLRTGCSRGPRIIMTTANDEQRHKDFAFLNGVDAFMGKPFDIEQLLAKVDTLLQV